MKKVLFFIVALLTAATAWAETQTVSYIDADGIEQTVTATVLTEGGRHETGWYIVSGNIEASSLIFDGIEVDVPTNLILADGATITLSNGLYALDVITIYGQRNGTGKFTVIPSNTDTFAFRANGDINIHGGVIEAIGGSVYGGGITTMSWDKEQHITITGGKVTAVGNSQSGSGISANMGNITITGGQVSTSGHYGLYVNQNGNLTITGGQVNASGDYGIYMNQNSGNQYGITL
ncbi:MAG: hypothetical protein IKX18_06330, partial [Muribaculaceae bacterium]|nr:hypothetical protein [Muribaculaceae bacterium]